MDNVLTPSQSRKETVSVMIAQVPSWHAALSKIVGETVAPPPDSAALDLMSVHGVKPAACCFPENEAQLAEIIRFARAHRIPVLPRGSGTGQHIGHAPKSGALVISTRKMSKLVEHEPGDMVATAQSGMTLGDFQAALLTNGQWLPLDAPPESTLGGLLAADRSGPLAHGYGTLRDMVLGTRIVNGDGVIRKCGGKVVKNVTGYALEKLYIGSLGTLGVVTEVTFRLRPLPIGRDGWRIPVPDAKAGVDLVAKIGARNLPLEVLRLISKDTARGQLGGLLDSHLNVVVGATGTTIELDRIHREIGEVIGSREIARFPWSRPDEILIEANSPGKGLLRFWCLSRQMQDVLTQLVGFQAISAGLNNGVVSLSLTPERVRQLGTALGGMGVNYRFEQRGSFVIDAPFGPARPEWTIMLQIKSALDPQGIMNPGRFVV